MAKSKLRNRLLTIGINSKLLLRFIIVLSMFFAILPTSQAAVPTDGKDRCKFPDNKIIYDFCTYRPKTSDYFSPQIVVMTRWCPLPGICGSDKVTFKNVGECKWLRWAGFIPIRYCVRIANAADPAKCPPGGCVNNEVTSDSASNRGNRATNRLKLCAYEDPCFLDAGDMGAAGLCIPFVKGDFQPYHRWTKILAAPDEAAAYKDLDIAEKVSSALIGSVAILTGNPAAVVFLGLKLLASLPGLKDYHNWIVIQENRNKCVEIPAGPSPPPYCPFLKDMPNLATVQQVCGAGQKSIIGATCATTIPQKNGFNATSNSFENNLIRVGYDSIVPKCDGDDDTNCVELYNPGNKDLHNDYGDFVNKCPTKPEDPLVPPCINFKSDGSNESQLKSDPPYRVMYRPVTTDDDNNLGTDAITWVSDPDNPNLKMEFYGINDANFYDLGVTVGNTGDATGKSSTDIKIVSKPDKVDIKDFSTGTTTFQAYVDLDSPMQVCIRQLMNSSTMEIGCVDRQPMPMPVIASCNSNTCSSPGNCPPTLGCSTTVSKPKMVIGLGNPMQYGYVGTVSTTLSGNTPEHLYLHGIDFTSILTDNLFKLADQNGGNLIGNYENVNGTNTYTGGLEFKDYKYLRGATKMCAKGYESADVMLAKLLSVNYPSSDPVDPSEPPIAPTTGISDQLDARIAPLYQTGVMTTSDTYNLNTPICYGGRVPPDCPVANDGTTTSCCNSCIPNCITYPDGTKQYDLAKVINSSTEGIRPKNAMEYGLCVDVPQPAPCPPDNSGTAGNATWTATAAGATATGTCAPGYVNNNTPPTRKCYPPADLNSPSYWGPVTNPCALTPSSPPPPPPPAPIQCFAKEISIVPSKDTIYKVRVKLPDTPVDGYYFILKSQYIIKSLPLFNKTMCYKPNILYRCLNKQWNKISENYSTAKSKDCPFATQINYNGFLNY